MLLADREGQVVSILAGSSEDHSWRTVSMPAIHIALDGVEQKLHFEDHSCLPVPSCGSKDNMCGKFKTVAIDVSYGGG